MGLRGSRRGGRRPQRVTSAVAAVGVRLWVPVEVVCRLDLGLLEYKREGV